MWLWTEHPQYFIAGYSQLWTSFQTRIQYFQCLLGYFEDKTEPILHSITLVFTCELGPIVFTTITGHTLWTYSWNGTVIGRLTWDPQVVISDLHVLMNWIRLGCTHSQKNIISTSVPQSLLCPNYFAPCQIWSRFICKQNFKPLFSCKIQKLVYH